MITNIGRFSHDVINKNINLVTQEESELIAKALYTGYALFWQDGVTILNYNYPGQNIVPEAQIAVTDSQLN